MSEKEIATGQEVVKEVLNNPALGNSVEINQHIVSNDMSQTFSMIIARVTRRPAWRIK